MDYFDDDKRSNVQKFQDIMNNLFLSSYEEETKDQGLKQCHSMLLLL